MYLNAAGQPTIVLNSLKSSFELLERRAITYSDRPDLLWRWRSLARVY